jgi:hypothetical protein
MKQTIEVCGRKLFLLNSSNISDIAAVHKRISLIIS